MEDSKKSDKVEFHFAGEIKAEDKNQGSSGKPLDVSKIYIKAPRILEGKFVNEAKRPKVSLVSELG